MPCCTLTYNSSLRSVGTRWIALAISLKEDRFMRNTGILMSFLHGAAVRGSIYGLYLLPTR